MWSVHVMRLSVQMLQMCCTIQEVIAQRTPTHVYRVWCRSLQWTSAYIGDDEEGLLPQCPCNTKALRKQQQQIKSKKHLVYNIYRTNKLKDILAYKLKQSNRCCTTLIFDNPQHRAFNQHMQKLVRYNNVLKTNRKILEKKGQCSQGFLSQGALHAFSL